MLLRYDVYKMKELLNSFYRLTKIRIVVYNDAFEKIAEVPEHDCSFCALVRSDAAAEEQCIRSDRDGFIRCRERNQLYSYTCHIGLTETVAPIRYQELVIGYLMFGQVLQCGDKNGYWSYIRENCSRYSLDMNILRDFYNQKKVIRLDEVTAAAQILEACAGFLWLQRTVSLQEDELPLQIDAYITENLQEDLSSLALCRQFNISRSKLYGIVKKYYGCGTEKLTRSLRIKRAKELLQTTAIPVSEISYSVGYPDFNYFIKVFKRESGVTPAKYRKQWLVDTEQRKDFHRKTGRKV